MKKKHRWINTLTLRQKLLVIFGCFGILPLAAVSLIYYHISTNILLSNAVDNLTAEVKKSNELISLRLERIEDSSLYLTVDENLHELMNVSEQPSKIDTLHGGVSIKKILDKYFMGTDGIFSYHLYTDYYLMAGNNVDRTVTSAQPSMYVPYDTFAESDIYAAATKANGKLVWIPTYSYVEMYKQTAYASIDYNYPYLFSAVKQINCIDHSKGRVAPILIVSFLPSYLDQIVLNDFLQGKGAQFYIVSEENRIISNSEGGAYGKMLNDQFIKNLKDESGQVTLHIDGCEYLMVYDTIKQTSWKQIVLLPTQAYMGSMSALPRITFISSLLLIILLILIVGIITKNMSGNMRALKNAMSELGNGNLAASIPMPDDREFGLLANGFNQMGEKIHTLISENYEIKLRQKEAQLAALNLQMNPHFLYNTLSTINWIAIDNDQQEISLALTHLSDMLHRSYGIKDDMVTVSQDLRWLEDYLYIMKLRFENRITFEYDIESELMDTVIPRNMFQPLVENAIIHGLQDVEVNGRVKIEAHLKEDHTRVFSVIDNGVGFNENDLSVILSKGSSGIGLSNLNYRLQAIYHDAYQIKVTTNQNSGTVISILLP
jgi:two-component system sensor histidine kinase YesM